MKSKIKIGVIGCGRWGETHLKALSTILDKTQLIACDPDENKLKKISNLVFLTFSDYKEIVKSSLNLKGVIIAAPTFLHYQIAKFFLLSGIDVFVEKPITLNSFQALELIKLSKKNKLLLVPGHIFLFKKAFRLIKKIFYQDEKNNIIIIKRINNGPSILNEGVIFDLGVHDIYLSLNLFQTVPQSVFAEDLTEKGGTISASIILKYKNGIVNIINSWTGLVSTREIHILNGKREILWQDTEPNFLIIRNTDKNTIRNFNNKKVELPGKLKKEKVYKFFNENALLEEDKAFLNSILTRKPSVNPEEGYYTIKIIEKIIESIKKRREVKI